MKLKKSTQDNLNRIISRKHELKDNIAKSEIFKTKAILEVIALDQEFKVIEDEMTKKYGKGVGVDLETGEITGASNTLKTVED